MRVIAAMESAGLEPDGVAYGTLLNVYYKIERINDGLSLFRELLEMNMKMIESRIPVSIQRTIQFLV